MWKQRGSNLKQAAVWKWLRSVDIPAGNIIVLSSLFEDIYPQNNFQSLGPEQNLIKVSPQWILIILGTALSYIVASLFLYSASSNIPNLSITLVMDFTCIYHLFTQQLASLTYI